MGVCLGIEKKDIEVLKELSLTKTEIKEAIKNKTLLGQDFLNDYKLIYG